MMWTSSCVQKAVRQFASFSLPLHKHYLAVYYCSDRQEKECKEFFWCENLGNKLWRSEVDI